MDYDREVKIKRNKKKDKIQDKTQDKIKYKIYKTFLLGVQRSSDAKTQ